MYTTKEQIDDVVNAIVSEFKDHGGAFVDSEEDIYITSDGEEVYNPTVDHETAESWLRERVANALGGNKEENG